MTYLINNVNNNRSDVDNKETCLFARAKRAVELPDGKTLAIGFDTQDEYGTPHGEMYILGSGCLTDNSLIMGFLEHTYWWQNFEGNYASSQEILNGIEDTTAGIRVRYNGDTPEIAETFCVIELDEHGYILDGLEMVPKPAEK